MKCCVRILFPFFLTLSCNAPSDEPIALEGDYVGQSPPNLGAVKLFAPDFISTHLSERDASFAPDGSEFYFTLMMRRTGMIVFSREENGQWQSPQTADFSGQYSDLEPFVTANGKRLYFVSNRPLEPGKPAKDYDIWYVDRLEGGWGEPQNLGSPVNTSGNEFYPTLAQNGNLYFTGRYENSLGGEDLYIAQSVNGTYTGIQNLGKAINSSKDEFNSYVATDETFIIFSSFGREDGLGGGDLYISFADDNGDWQDAQNMGEPINSTALDYCPSFSADSKYFFFTSRRSAIPPGTEVRRVYENVVAQLAQPGNGNDDIYWINSAALWALKRD